MLKFAQDSSFLNLVPYLTMKSMKNARAGRPEHQPKSE